MGREDLRTGSLIESGTRRRRVPTAEQDFVSMVDSLRDLSQPGFLVGEEREHVRGQVRILAGRVLETIREHPRQRNAVASAFWDLAVENRGLTLSAYHALIGGKHENIPFVRQIINLPRPRRRPLNP